MMEFMVLGLPRSGTAWLANWLTAGPVLCWHEPLRYLSPLDLEGVGAPERRLGIADTGLLMLYPDWVAMQPARKLIVHRDLVAVNESLARLALPLMTVEQERRLWAVEGWHISFAQLFQDRPAVLQQALDWLVPGVAFDEPRYRVLKEMNVQNTAAIELCQGIAAELGG